jgi:serine protease inhibitor
VSTIGKDSNMVASPFSISAVMAMAYAGARENTAGQMKSVLSYPEKDLVLQEGYEDMINVLQSNENFTLEAANRLFVHKNYKLLEAYTTLVEKHYRALPETVDFGQSEKTRGIINTWVEQQTKDKIKDLLPEGSLNALTRLVLVNAVYFKGDWKNKFNKSDTQKKTFTTAAGAQVDVDMMHKTAEYKGARNKDLDCTILEMPYKGDRLSMLVFLSGMPEGFDAMEAKFASLDFLNLKMHGQVKFEVSLPKFKLESSHNLVDNLKAIGMTDMFDMSKADFSGIDGTKDLYVSSVMQKAFIEVNEEGSEAAAATGMVMMMRSMPAPPQKFTCDRPFLFAIKDNLSGMVLFTGRVVDPTK